MVGLAEDPARRRSSVSSRLILVTTSKFLPGASRLAAAVEGGTSMQGAPGKDPRVQVSAASVASEKDSVGRGSLTGTSF